MKNLIKYFLCGVWKLFFQKKAQKHLFLMGHPRSGSSLLMHIITSNSEIIGYGEYLTKYNSTGSFDLAEFDIRRKAGGLFKNFKFIANQINHHSITPNIDLLRSKDIKFVILIRKPATTLSSMHFLSKNAKKPMLQSQITDIYVERLQYLSMVTSYIKPSQWTYAKYEDIITNTKSTLQELSGFLNLQENLTPDYKLKKYSQVWGDPSKNIIKGTVFNTLSEQIIFDEIQLAKAEIVYQETLANLQSKKTN